jgi:Tfp pilus assembly protein PilE
MSEENGNGAVDFKTPIFSASLKGKDIQIRDVIVLAILCLTAVTAYAFWEHKVEVKEAAHATVTEQKEMTKAMREMVAAQREQTCVSLLPESRRFEEFTSQFSRCKQIARER